MYIKYVVLIMKVVAEGSGVNQTLWKYDGRIHDDYLFNIYYLWSYAQVSIGFIAILCIECP